MGLGDTIKFKATLKLPQELVLGVPSFFLLSKIASARKYQSVIDKDSIVTQPRSAQLAILELAGGRRPPGSNRFCFEGIFKKRI